MIETTHAAPLAARLKSETRAAHEAAEHHPLQQMLVRGALPRPAYAAHLGQLLLLHRALDAALVRIREARPLVRELIEDWQLQSPYLEADLDYFGIDVEFLVASPATREAIDRITRSAAGDDLELVGAHYVLEGSKNGSRFIARSIRRSLRLEGTEGTLYLEPYGEEQPARWQRFRSGLDSLNLTSAECDRVVAGAAWMFETIGRIGTDVLQGANPIP